MTEQADEHKCSIICTKKGTGVPDAPCDMMTWTDDSLTLSPVATQSHDTSECKGMGDGLFVCSNDWCEYWMTQR